MQAEVGKRVKIKFACMDQDGRPRDLGVGNVLEFVVGLGKTLPSLEKGVLGMVPGGQKMVRVPTAELKEFSLCEERAPAEPHPHRGKIGGGIKSEREDDVVILPPPARLAPHDEAAPSGLYLLFEIILMEVNGRR